MSLRTRHRTLALLVTLCALIALMVGFTGCSGAESADRGVGISGAVADPNGDVLPARRLPGQPAERIDEDDLTGDAGGAVPSETSDGTQPEGELVARFLDVGQGDATLITCDGHAMLIDGGPPSASSKLYSVLKSLGIGHLDYVVASHPDADHIGGIPGALTAASVGRVFCSVNSADTARFEAFERVSREDGAVVEVPAVGTVLPLGSATAEIIGPVVRFGDDNDDSLVVKVTYGETAMLFMGDAELSAEQTLLDEGVDVRADVLKVGHHGSKTSSSAFFVQEVDPTYAVISVGENSYGHPNQAVLDMFSSMGVETLRTDLMGDVILVSNGQDVLLQGD